jgi:hypothetical protein
MNKNLSIAICLIILALPKFVLADAPPPPPLTVDATYQGQKVADEKFDAVILTCQPGQSHTENVSSDKLNITQDDPANSCVWKPYSAPTEPCSVSRCHFRWVLGNFKVAVYLPSFDGVFISNQLNRKYEGHYGLDTPRNYRIMLSKDGESILSPETSVPDDPSGSQAISDTGPHPDYNDPSRNPEFMAQVGLSLQIILSFVATLFVELIVILIFALVKKFPKKILVATIIGNIISVPLLWIIVTKWYQVLYPAEILVVVFEAWVIKLLLKEKIDWKWCLIISLAANIASFIFGPIILSY